jgi:hypothetical protein
VFHDSILTSWKPLIIRAMSTRRGTGVTEGDTRRADKEDYRWGGQRAQPQRRQTDKGRYDVYTPEPMVTSGSEAQREATSAFTTRLPRGLARPSSTPCFFTWR